MYRGQVNWLAHDWLKQFFFSFIVIQTYLFAGYHAFHVGVLMSSYSFAFTWLPADMKSRKISAKSLIITKKKKKTTIK